MPKRRTKTEATPIEPGERQRCRFPEQWDRISQQQQQVEAERARCLIEGAPISWDDLLGLK